MPENRVNASDDVIGALSDRVGELSKRVNSLESELETAQKRLAVYEEYDKAVQEAISGALRAAYQIRERAEATANQILEQAREERRLLLNEVERLRDERDALTEEIARERRGGIAAVAPRGETAAASGAGEAQSGSELRAIATEALRSMFKDLVAEVARTTQAAPPAARAPESTVAAAPSPIEELPVTPREEAVVTAEPAVLEVVVTAEPAVEEPVAAEEPELTGTPLFVETPAASLSEPTATALSAPAWPSPPPAPTRPPLYEVPRPEPVPPVTVEDTEIVPQREEAGAPMAEIQLVLSPVSSFARLVDVERRIQTISTIRSLYVRDFRGGVATLAVGLRSPMTLDQFAEALAGLGQPPLRPVSASRNSLELRLEGDASTA